MMQKIISCFQISFIMSHQSNLDDLSKSLDNSEDDQEDVCSIVEVLLDKVVNLEKGLKDLQVQQQGHVSCHKCVTSEQEKKVSDHKLSSFKLTISIWLTFVVLAQMKPDILLGALNC